MALTLILMSMALNQSGIVAGLNLSLADPLALACLLLFVAQQELLIPLRALLFYLLVAATATFTAVVVTPDAFGIRVEELGVVADLLKLTTSFVYLIIGFNLASRGLALLVVKWFAIGAAVVALIGLSVPLLGVHELDKIIYYGGFRFRGFMNDPNYFAVLACAAIAYFIRCRDIGRHLRLANIGVLIVAILMSGSKTGFIALLLLFAVCALEHVCLARRSAFLATLLVLFGVAVALFWNDISRMIVGLGVTYGEEIPQLHRVAQLFDDSAGATSEGGSIRDQVWQNALMILGASPILGVGFGSYTAVTEQLAGQGLLAHNTYLQIASEWGIPLAILFFGWFFVTIVRGTFYGHKKRLVEILILRDVLLVFAIGSLALSLNNARMFWLFLGAIIWLQIRRRASNLAPESVAQNRL